MLGASQMFLGFMAHRWPTRMFIGFCPRIYTPIVRATACLPSTFALKQASMCPETLILRPKKLRISSLHKLKKCIKFCEPSTPNYLCNLQPTCKKQLTPHKSQNHKAQKKCEHQRSKSMSLKPSPPNLYMYIYMYISYNPPKKRGLHAPKSLKIFNL